MRRFGSAAAGVAALVFGLAPLAGQEPEVDERSTFWASFYLGGSIDNFAADSLQQYYNPTESNDRRFNYIAGINFSFRLRGNEDSKRALWVFGETLHGVRSTDVNCADNPSTSVCAGVFDPADAQGRFLYILRNATSLEGHIGLRYEFLQLAQDPEYTARLYVTVKKGFLTVDGNGGDAVDDNTVSLGLVMTTGRFVGSFLEVGAGRTDLYGVYSDERFKINAFLTWEQWESVRFWPFIQFTVNADNGPGSDSFQSYLGFDFDVECLLLNCRNTDDGS